MSLQRATLRTVIDSSLCRRRQQRRKIHARQVRSWKGDIAPTPVTVIEADVKGARLMFPFWVAPNDSVTVSFEDEMGLYQTRVARIAWTQSLPATGKIVAGVAFDVELSAAA